MATQGHSSPCEGPDLSNEGVYLEYSTNGGTSWTTIFYFQPQSYTSWAQYCYPIPSAAQTTSTIFQWWQSGSSGSSYDHWGIDNVTIDAVNCNSLWYDWSHVSGTTGPIGDDSTQTVNVISDTTFTVCYTDGQGFSCCESITITVQGMGPPIVNTTDEISASVKINENMVAKLGAIIPEPFAIPAILTILSPILISEKATFGLVSVVKIAVAVFNQISLF